MKKIIRLTALLLLTAMIASTLLTSCSWFENPDDPNTPSGGTTKPECKHVDADTNGFCDD